MLEGLASLITYGGYRLSSVANALQSAYVNIDEAGGTLYNEGHQYAGNQLVMAGVHLRSAAYFLAADPDPINTFKYFWLNALQLIDTNWPTGGDEYELTMDDLLNVMLNAEYEEFQDFIGYVDGYRYALWDNWYNKEYYEALARGFKERSPSR